MTVPQKNLEVSVCNYLILEEKESGAWLHLGERYLGAIYRRQHIFQLRRKKRHIIGWCRNQKGTNNDRVAYDYEETVADKDWDGQ